jgi:hypothetical protein
VPLPWLNREGVVLRNGIYSVFYADPADAASTAEALAFVRDGAVFGSDRHGAVFKGAVEDNAAEARTLSGTLTVPPFGELVTGYIAGPEGATIAISGILDALNQPEAAVVEIGGSSLSLTLCYVGPLPD